MKYQLVVQFTAPSEKEFDWLVRLEDELITLVGNKHKVDGHDFGSREMNLFIHTYLPEGALEKAKVVLFKKKVEKYESGLSAKWGEQIYSNPVRGLQR